MKKNRLMALIIVAALSAFAVGCGGSAEMNANSSVAANSNSSVSETKAEAPNNTAAPNGVANTGAPPDAATKNAGRNAQATKDPAPQIGTGGNDMYLFTKTRAALNADNELKAAAINININAGVVTLTGKVADEAQKAKAEQLVRGVEGVNNVKNQLRASPGGAKR